MRDCGIYIRPNRFSDGRCVPTPTNVEEMREALNTKRETISPVAFKPTYEYFHDIIWEWQSDEDWKRTALPLIEGNKPGFFSGQDVTLTNLDPLTEWDATVRLRPNICDGAALDAVNPTVRCKLNKVIVPTRINCKLVCPNFFMISKTAGGDQMVLRRQIMHNGAIGARAMHMLQNYGQNEPKYDGRAYTISVLYHNGVLYFFAHHVARGVEKGPPEYFMTFLKATEICLTGEAACLDGISAFRNARDWAKSTRDQLIKEANQRASFGTMIDNHILIDSANSANTGPDDEDAK